MIKPNVQERQVDELECQVRLDIEAAYEDIAMSHGLTLEFVRAIAVQMFSPIELDYANGKVT